MIFFQTELLAPKILAFEEANIQFPKFGFVSYFSPLQYISRKACVYLQIKIQKSPKQNRIRKHLNFCYHVMEF